MAHITRSGSTCQRVRHQVSLSVALRRLRSGPRMREHTHHEDPQRMVEIITAGSRLFSNPGRLCLSRPPACLRAEPHTAGGSGRTRARHLWCAEEEEEGGFQTPTSFTCRTPFSSVILKVARNEVGRGENTADSVRTVGDESLSPHGTARRDAAQQQQRGSKQTTNKKIKKEK